MHFSVKEINGKKYNYVSDTIYVAKSKSKTKNKSLGRIDSALDEKELKLMEFENNIIKEEVEERKKYWKSKMKNKLIFEVENFESIENLRGSLYRGKESLSEFGQFGLESAFKTDFIYNSNKLEGSRVPRKTIEEAIRKGGRSNAEVKNSLDALAYTKDAKNLFAVRNIVNLHKVLLGHEPSKHGIRKESIVVGNFATLEFKKIPKALKDLLGWFNKMNHKMYPPELAFEFYYRFERIHPFKDGNGRIGRLLMNNILKQHRYHPIIIWDNNREAHMNAFAKAIDGSSNKYFRFMAEQMKITYDIYSKKIKKAREIEKNIADTFFTPSR